MDTDPKKQNEEQEPQELDEMQAEAIAGGYDLSKDQLRRIAAAGKKLTIHRGLLAEILLKSRLAGIHMLIILYLNCDISLWFDPPCRPRRIEGRCPTAWPRTAAHSSSTFNH